MNENPNIKIRNTKQYQNSNVQNSKQKHRYTMLLSSFCFDHLNLCHLNLFRISCFGIRIYYPRGIYLLITSNKTDFSMGLET